MIQSSNQWSDLIDKLASKLSVPAAHLWSVLVRQARIEAIEAAIWVLISGSIAVYCSTHWRRLNAWIDDNGCAEVWIPFGILVIASVIVFAVNLSILIGGLLNPEFMALQYILKAAR